ncbi:hypothetical protein E2320_014652 [Naja naja]|nr:hypothetical protein E2320_014652 [Naja naja]
MILDIVNPGLLRPQVHLLEILMQRVHAMLIETKFLSQNSVCHAIPL